MAESPSRGGKEDRWRCPATGRLALACCALLGVEVAVAALSLALPPILEKLQHASPVVLDRRGAWLRALPVEQGRWRLRADLDHLDPSFLRRLVALEDARFYLHPGVDPVAALRAAAGDLRARRIHSSGLTLDMQLARRLHPRPRTPAAKLIESLRALQLDASLGKRGVLAAYLTLAPTAATWRACAPRPRPGSATRRTTWTTPSRPCSSPCPRRPRRAAPTATPPPPAPPARRCSRGSSGSA